MAIIKTMREHKEDCLSVRNHPENPWAYFGSAEDYNARARGQTPIPRVLYMDAMGRRTTGAYRRWITAGCNDPDCPAVFAIQESALLRFAQFALERKQK